MGGGDAESSLRQLRHSSGPVLSVWQFPHKVCQGFHCPNNVCRQRHRGSLALRSQQNQRRFAPPSASLVPGDTPHELSVSKLIRDYGNTCAAEVLSRLTVAIAGSKYPRITSPAFGFNHSHFCRVDAPRHSTRDHPHASIQGQARRVILAPSLLTPTAPPSHRDSHFWPHPAARQAGSPGLGQTRRQPHLWHRRMLGVRAGPGHCHATIPTSRPAHEASA